MKNWIHISVAMLMCLLTWNAFSQDNSPNILIIMTDQQTWNALGCAGNRIVNTPNLDRLASQGVLFTQAVTAVPICVPARTSILTGRLAETTTIRNNRDIVNDCYYPTFAEILVKRGYTAEYHGKFHAPEHMAKVYSNSQIDGMSGTESIINSNALYKKYLKEKIERRDLKEGELYDFTFYPGIPYKVDPLDRRYKYMPSGEIPEDELKQKKLGQSDVHGVLDLQADLTITAFQAREALDALERLKDTKFIMTCSFHCPHVPILPSEPYASLYPKKNMIPPVSIKDPKTNSPYKTDTFELQYSDEELIKGMIANYYAFVTEIDDWVGKILDKLDYLGLSDNTLVVFVSDHGEMLGAHGMRGKFNFYEESVRVPFMIRYPGKIKGGQRIEVPVSTLNIFPTLLDYAGVTNIPTDGYSLKGLMEGAVPKYDFAVSEWDWSDLSKPSIMIRTQEWKLMTTHRHDGENIDVLFNLRNDPYELNNLLGSNPERFKYINVVEELRAKLVGYLEDVNSPFAEGVATREIIRK